MWLKSIDRFARAPLLAALALAASGCSSGEATRGKAEAAAGLPDAASVAAYQQALAALDDGDAAAGEAQLQALARAHPDYSGPLVNLAIIRAGRNETAEAMALLEQAVAVCTRCAAPWNELGLLQRGQGRFTDAEQSYLQAVAADPGYANAWFNLGVLYELYLQRPELALANYERYRELQSADHPDGADVDKWIADLSRRTGKVEQAARVEERQ
jgi:tetratricopeptide (TPR) repeat protein